MARRIGSIAALVLAATHMVACRAARDPDAGALYATPQDAVDALVDAARDGSAESLARVFGVDAESLFIAGDPVVARAELDLFVDLYDETYALEDTDEDVRTLLVGPDDWPFPVPLERVGKRWAFDTDEGRQEILDRRVGKNELSAIEVCRAIGDAQEEFRAVSPDANGGYSTRFVSEEGRRNGLFWPSSGEGDASPLGELAAAAAGEGYTRAESGERTPYHGYYFRLLGAQGDAAPGGARAYVEEGEPTSGYAIVAWPAEYGASGIMTFVMGRRGIVYERDFGDATHDAASTMTAFDPTLDWAVCGD